MEIVAGDPAPTMGRDEAARLLLEMAAVVRTVFAVNVPAEVAVVPTPPAAPPAVDPTPLQASPVSPAPVALMSVPTIPSPPAAAPPVAVAAIPLPSTPGAPSSTDFSTDSPERRSLALLQEIAFLDD